MQETTYVQHAIEQHVTRSRQPYDSGDSKPLLWASDMNKCPRKAMLRVTSLAQPTIEPDTKMQLYFQAGNMWEDDTAASLRWYYGDDLTEQLNLKNEIWSGKCDFALYHGNDDRQTVLIEHKAKGSKWWNYNDQLPQADHIGQLYTYWHLYKEIHGSEPLLVLFYRTWGHYAEFYLKPELGYIDIHGEIDGKAVVKRHSTDLAEIKREMEHYYMTGELPERLTDKEAGCTFRGKPSCPYYHYCWENNSQEPETASLDKPQETIYF